MKIKEAIKNNSLLFKALLFVIIFVIEVFLIKVSIDTAHTSSFDYLSFNFQSTELPLYFLLIFLVVANGKIFNLKSEFSKKRFFYLIPHIAFMVGFYFYTLFVIDNPELVANNVWFFKITWYGSALAPLLFLGLFFFPFSDVKKYFIDFKKELGIALVLSFLFLFLFEKLSPLLYDVGMLAANMAIGSIKKIVSDFIVTPGANLGLRYGLNRVTYSPLCSGVIGYVFFVLFYLLYCAVNYKTLDRIRAIVVFFMGFIFFFVMDYIRNFVSLYVWIISPNFGVQLFHSNLRPIYYTINLFIVYFVFRKWILKKEVKKTVKKRKKK
ncbi:hypothetical protein KY345_01025 [Candidatus Woesearchaeota archaeon]|nr:hypothetical protein [Candidatus Woesearchaeota archaeon]